VTSPQRRKGSTAEREAANLLHELSGWPVRRRLQEGRADDAGDLEGVPNTVVSVKNYASLDRALRDGLPALDGMRTNARATWAVLMLRRRGGSFVVTMTAETFVSILREATC
jgi:hypothetical protein